MRLKATETNSNLKGEKGSVIKILRPKCRNTNRLQKRTGNKKSKC